MNKLLHRVAGPLLPCLVTIAVSLVALTQVDVTNIRNYLYTPFAMSLIVLLPGSIVFTLAAAVRTSNLREVRGFLKTVSRNRFLILARELFPLFLSFLISYLTVLLFLLTKVGASVDPMPAHLILLSVAFEISIISFGALCGLVFPKVFAYSIGTVVPLVWAGFTVASNYFPLHYATGLLFTSCCRIYEVLDLEAVWLAFSWNATFAVILVFLIKMLLSKQRRNLTIEKTVVFLGLLSILVSASWLGNQVAPTPQEFRNPSEVECSGSLPAICLYPLQDSVPAIRSTLKSSWKTLKEIFPSIPTRIVGREAHEGEIGIVIFNSSTANEVVYSLAADAIGTPTLCNESEISAERRDLVYRLLQNIFLKQVQTDKINVSYWRASLDRDELKILNELDSLPYDAKRTWVTKALSVIKNCTIEPSTS